MGELGLRGPRSRFRSFYILQANKSIVSLQAISYKKTDVFPLYSYATFKNFFEG